MRTAYADGWLSFQADGREDRRRLAPVPHGWETASEDELRTYLHSARPPERTDLLSGTAEAVAQNREEQRAETVERENAERTPPEPRPSAVDGGALERIKKILGGIRVGRDHGP